MTVQCMIDLETLGTKAGCKILSIGACVFHYINGVSDKFYVEIQRDNQGTLVEDPNTIAWWAKQSVEARLVLDQYYGDKQPLFIALDMFNEWLEGLEPGVGVKKSVHPWGNSARFDLGILEAAYRMFGLDIPWDGFNEICYRTFKRYNSAGLTAPIRQGTHHNALDDSIYQAEYAIKMLKKNKELNHGL